MSSSIAIVSAATHYAFEQNGGVALSGKLGYIYVSPEGVVKTESDLTNVTFSFGGDLMSYKDMFPAYHTSEIESAQIEALKLLKR